MNIYFAGSIRGGRNDKELYKQIIKHLQTHGTVLTEHVGDKTLSALGEDGPNDKYIYDRDMTWLKTADIVVAEVTTASLGVGYEIAYAETLGIKTLCLFREQDGKRLSAMIGGSPHVTNMSYKTLEEAIKIIDQYLKSN